MFERFTDRARRVVVLAQVEAAGLRHNYIGTEHLLLGLIREREGVAAEALASLGISLEAVRAQVEEIIGKGEDEGKGDPSGHIPFTPRAKKVLELSFREALQLGHNYIGTEHILLGLVREAEGVAAQVLVKLGGDLARVRQAVTVQLEGRSVGEAAALRGVVREPRPTVVGGPGVFEQREPPELVRVVPLAREAVSRRGYRLMLISLEIWSNGMDLRYALLALAPLETYPLPGATHRWRLTDDLGTTYELSGATSGAGRTVHLHQLTFQPAPPPEASVLTLTLKDEDDADIATAEIPLVDEPA
jgi:Clp amino terminal domain, pathogenicity island component